MSDMQRAAGPLFAKMREFTQGLTSLQVDVNSIRNIVDYVKVEFDSGIRLVDNDLNDLTKRMDHMMLKLNDESTKMTNRFDQVVLQLDTMTSLLMQERERNDTAFSVVVIMIAVMLGYIISMSNHMTSKGQTCHILLHNVTDGHRHETVMDRSDVRIIADWFAWLFVRPWMN
jgi:hypothetical protein